MKKTIVLILFGCLISCSTSKKVEEIGMVTNPNNYKIYKISGFINNRTALFSELRFYDINSARDTQKTMYLDFGKWSKESNGIYQANINQKIWENIKLFENEKPFTIIADGTETINDYFASLIILDSSGNDCLTDEHPLKNKLVDLFSQRMKINKTKKVDYSIFRK